VRSILVIKLSALGDVVQTSGAIRDIREHHPHDRITVLTTPPYRRFMEKCPWVDDVLIDRRPSLLNLPGILKLRKDLRAGLFDRVYDLQQRRRTRLYRRWFLPAVEWCGDVKGGMVYLKQDEVKTFAQDRLARMLKLAGIVPRHTLKNDASWMADPVEDILAEAGLKDAFIVLFPGASAAHPEKRWPYFKELAERLQSHGKQVVTIPGPDELELCRSLPGKMLVPENGYYDFFKLAGIVKHARYIIGNDTGPTHIAANVGCQGLALYGGHAKPEWTGIQLTGFSWLQEENLADLSVDTVWEKISGLI